MASAFDLSGRRTYRTNWNRRLSYRHDDGLAEDQRRLAGDWQAVQGDMARAIKKVCREEERKMTMLTREEWDVLWSNMSLLDKPTRENLELETKWLELHTYDEYVTWYTTVGPGGRRRK
jgi:BMFP domain-containing protein YqiC